MTVLKAAKKRLRLHNAILIENIERSDELTLLHTLIGNIVALLPGLEPLIMTFVQSWARLALFLEFVGYLGKYTFTNKLTDFVDHNSERDMVNSPWWYGGKNRPDSLVAKVFLC